MVLTVAVGILCLSIIAFLVQHIVRVDDPGGQRKYLMSFSSLIIAGLVAVGARHVTPSYVPAWLVLASASVMLVSMLTVYSVSSPSWLGLSLDSLFKATAAALTCTSVLLAVRGGYVDLTRGMYIVTNVILFYVMLTLFSIARARAVTNQREAWLLRSFGILINAASVWSLAHEFTGARWQFTVAQVLAGFAAANLSYYIAVRTKINHFTPAKGKPNPRPDYMQYAIVIFAVASVVFGLTQNSNINQPIVYLLAIVALALNASRQLVTLAEYEKLRVSTESRSAHYRTIVQNSSDVISLADLRSGVSQFVSPAARHVLGIDARPGRSHISEVMGISRRQVAAQFDVLIEGHGAQRVDGQVDGKIIESHLTRHGDQVLITTRDVTERETMRNELHRMAFVDPLTELNNRNRFTHRLRERLEDDYQRVALLFIDLDRFKQVNDTGGHEAGDEVLLEVSHRLRSAVATSTVLGRLGGDEFVAIIDRFTCDPVEVATRLAHLLQAPFHVNGRNYSLGGSFGVAVADEPTSASELMRRADLAMYQAKRTRTQVVSYTEELSDAAVMVSDSDATVAQALQDRNFQLDFQPQISLATGQIIGVEALVRWIDPKGQVQGPGALLDFAGRTNQGGVITEWVLDRAFAYIRDTDESVEVAVNLPPSQLLDPHLCTMLSAYMEKHDVNPNRVVLELTENDLVDRSQQAIQALESLHALGVRILIDDFGAGYSSLGYLVDLPIDGLKVDRQFVTALPYKDTARTIFQSLVHLARQHGHQLIAEGIETAEEHEWVTQLGCPIGQGYYYAKPQRADTCRPLNSLALWHDNTRQTVSTDDSAKVS